MRAQRIIFNSSGAYIYLSTTPFVEIQVNLVALIGKLPHNLIKQRTHLKWTVELWSYFDLPGSHLEYIPTYT